MSPVNWAKYWGGSGSINTGQTSKSFSSSEDVLAYHSETKRLNSFREKQLEINKHYIDERFLDYALSFVQALNTFEYEWDGLIGRTAIAKQQDMVYPTDISLQTSSSHFACFKQLKVEDIKIKFFWPSHAVKPFVSEWVQLFMFSSKTEGLFWFLLHYYRFHNVSFEKRYSFSGINRLSVTLRLAGMLSSFDDSSR